MSEGQIKSISAAKPKRSRKVKAKSAKITARPETESVAGGLERVICTIELMARAKQIDTRQQNAAEKFAEAHAALFGSIAAIDYGAAGGGSVDRSPAYVALVAAETIREARARLYAHDFRVVDAVCGEGHTVAEAAAAMDLRSGAKNSQQREIGATLRRALKELADLWFPLPRVRTEASKWGRVRRLLSDHAEGATDYVADNTAVSPGQTAHASRHKVFSRGG